LKREDKMKVFFFFNALKFAKQRHFWKVPRLTPFVRLLRTAFEDEDEYGDWWNDTDNGNPHYF
jgi:hypothetical protein